MGQYLLIRLLQAPPRSRQNVMAVQAARLVARRAAAGIVLGLLASGHLLQGSGTDGSGDVGALWSIGIGEGRRDQSRRGH